MIKFPRNFVVEDFVFSLWNMAVREVNPFHKFIKWSIFFKKSILNY